MAGARGLIDVGNIFNVWALRFGFIIIKYLPYIGKISTFTVFFSTFSASHYLNYIQISIFPTKKHMLKQSHIKFLEGLNIFSLLDVTSEKEVYTASI